MELSKAYKTANILKYGVIFLKEDKDGDMLLYTNDRLHFMKRESIDLSIDTFVKCSYIDHLSEAIMSYSKYSIIRHIECSPIEFSNKAMGSTPLLFLQSYDYSYRKIPPKSIGNPNGFLEALNASKKKPPNL